MTAQMLGDDTPLRKSAAALLSDRQYGAAVVPHPFAEEIGLRRVSFWNEIGAAAGGKIVAYV